MLSENGKSQIGLGAKIIYVLAVPLISTLNIFCTIIMHPTSYSIYAILENYMHSMQDVDICLLWMVIGSCATKFACIVCLKRSLGLMVLCSM